MLDFFAVISTGGVILWMNLPLLTAEYRAAVDHVMQAVVIDGTFVGTFLVRDTLCLHWLRDHELGLLYLVLGNSFLYGPCADDT